MQSAADIRIREYIHPRDYLEVHLLWEMAGAGIQLRRSDTQNEIQKKIERDPDLFLVAVNDEKIVGTVIGGFDGRRGLIYHLAVDTSLREHGIGSRLMETVESRLKAKGCIRCYLLVTKDNKEAMCFYEKRGWEVMNSVVLYGKDL